MKTDKRKGYWLRLKCDSSDINRFIEELRLTEYDLFLELTEALSVAAIAEHKRLLAERRRRNLTK